MYRETMASDYERWLWNIGKVNYRGKTYDRLFGCLHDVPFYFVIALDENRSIDGSLLKERFADSLGISEIDLRDSLFKQCSVLEMLLAMCIRAEESIMSDDIYGDRTHQWFWHILTNLGLDKLDNNNFDRATFSHIISRFLNREYDANGRGGPFYLDNPQQDMSQTELWYQFMWYLSEHI